MLLDDNARNDTDFIGAVKGKVVGIVVTEVKNPHFFVYMLDIAFKLKAKGKQVVFIEMSQLKRSHNYIPKESFRRKKENRSKTQRYRENFFLLVKKSFRILQLEGNDTLTVPRKVNLMLKIGKRKEPDPLELRRSLRSIGITHLFKSSKNSYSFRVKRQKKVMTNSFWQTKSELSEVLKKTRIDTIVSLNGRKPDQAAITCVTRESNLEHFYFEHGSIVGERYYFAPVQPHNVKELQIWYKGNVIEKRSSEQREKIHAEAINWLKQRHYAVPNFGQPTNTVYRAPENLSSKKTIVIFISSLSEMSFNEGEGVNQITAIKKLLEKIRTEGVYHLIFRFHPNLLNYNWHDLVAIHKTIKAVLRNQNTTETTYIFPWSRLSSYSLLAEAEGVITWNSTMALEAAFVGLKIGVMAETTFYSDICGIKPLDLEGLPDVTSQLVSVPQEKVLDAVSSLIDLGETLDKQLYGNDVFAKIIGSDSYKRNTDKGTQPSKNYLSFLKTYKTPLFTYRIMSKVLGQERTKYVLEFILNLESNYPTKQKVSFNSKKLRNGTSRS
jgi:hypothetical protein